MAESNNATIYDEVETLFFQVDDVHVKAGEVDTGEQHRQLGTTDYKLTRPVIGMLFVVEGILDVSLPPEDGATSKELEALPLIILLGLI
jgi:hypothetical protein